MHLELGHRAAGLPVRRVLVVRGEEPECVVAPVVSQAQVEQPLVVHELVHRHQFERGDVERLEVVDDRRVGQAGVGAAKPFGDAGMGLRHALDVGLIDDRLVVRGQRCAVERPVEEGLITTLVMVWPSESTIGGVPVSAVSPFGSTAFRS